MSVALDIAQAYRKPVAVFRRRLGDGKREDRALAALMAPTGANERLVRTSLQRLATDGLVTAERRGRQSFYRVAPEAVGTFADADARIYAGGRVDWDGEWTVAVIDPDADDRDLLRTELRWLGLGAVSPGVHVSPTVGIATVEAALARHTNPLVLLTRGPSAPGVTSGDAALLAPHRCAPSPVAGGTRRSKRWQPRTSPFSAKAI